jgi:dTDP-4-amino-4,6-dideoxygalactose transaminase
MNMANKHGLPVVEDCAQAHGASFNGKRVGSFGVAGVFSFQCTKNLSCGEGGMIVTNDRSLYAECWHYHTSGRALEGASELGGLVLMGTNARMAEWEAAILDVQMDELPAQMAHRQKMCKKLYDMLRNKKWLVLPPEDARITDHALHLFTFVLKGEELGMTRDEWLKAVQAEGIPAFRGYSPLYNDEMFISQSFKRMTAQSQRVQLPLPQVEAAAPWNVLLGHNILLGTDQDLEDVVAAFDKVAEAVGKGGEN